jgi:hypothetical protein
MARYQSPQQLADAMCARWNRPFAKALSAYSELNGGPLVRPPRHGRPYAKPEPPPEDEEEEARERSRRRR